MRKKRRIVAGLLCSLLLNPLVLSVAAAETKPAEDMKKAEETKEVILTKLETEGEKVTLTLEMQKDSQVTSGRIGVYYDKKLLELSETETGDFWQTEDVNEEVEIKGKQGLSYAWADTNKLTEEQKLLIVSFQAGEQADGKEISVETEILELFSGHEPVTTKWKNKTDKIQIDLAEESQNQENQDENTPDGDEREKHISSGVKTGDQTELAGYILLVFGAVMVILDVGRKRMKS